MHIFYVENATPDLRLLPREESNHASRVLRLKKGSELLIINGKGDRFLALVENPHHKNCEIQIVKHEHQEQVSRYKHIAVAPTKSNDRFEWMLEKLTEIGVDEITPVICSRSERKIYKTDRGNRVIVAALKQSGNLWKPKLNEAVNFREFIANRNLEQGFIAHCISGCGSDQHLINRAKKNLTTTILIGPEGDFTEMEVSEAEKNGYLKVGLGNSRLRTETAAIVACHTLHLLHD